MKKYLLIAMICFCTRQSYAQIDLNNLNLKDIFGKIMHVEHGFAPKFSLGNFSIPKIHKVAEILSLKKNSEVDRLFRTFNTGRTIYKIVANGGALVSAYGLIKKVAGD